MATRTALVAGATGLVGRKIIERLIASERYGTVTALVRRSLAIEHPKLVERFIDFDLLAKASLPRFDDVYCALGTTIKTAGSQEAFRRVDFTYVQELARAGVRAGCQRFLLVSAAGADASSRIFYSRVKGEIEEAVAAEPYESVIIVRPSILVGERSESRPAERIGIVLMKALAFAMIGPLRRYRPVSADGVARTMIDAALAERVGVRVIESEEIGANPSPQPPPRAG